MKSYLELATDGDNARRKACGWGGGAWVGIEFPEPRTEAEAEALRLVEESFPSTISVHVYALVDFLAEVLEEKNNA